MDMLRLSAFCVACLLPVTLLRKKTPEQALLLTIAVLLAAASFLLGQAVPLIERLTDLFDRAGIETVYVSVLLRTVAAALVTRLCANLCKDGGSQAMASLVETAGAVAMLLIALPLLEAVADLLLGYFT